MCCTLTHAHGSRSHPAEGRGDARTHSHTAGRKSIKTVCAGPNACQSEFHAKHARTHTRTAAARLSSRVLCSHSLGSGCVSRVSVQFNSEVSQSSRPPKGLLDREQPASANNISHVTTHTHTISEHSVNISPHLSRQQQPALGITTI